MVDTVFRGQLVYFSTDGTGLIGAFTPSPVPVTLTSRSGTITLGGTAQQAAAANTSRKGFSIQNLSTGDLYFSTIATAVVGQPSMLIPPGALYESPQVGFSSGAISIIGATTGQAYSAREW